MHTRIHTSIQFTEDAARMRRAESAAPTCATRRDVLSRHVRAAQAPPSQFILGVCNTRAHPAAHNRRCIAHLLRAFSMHPRCAQFADLPIVCAVCAGRGTIDLRCRGATHCHLMLLSDAHVQKVIRSKEALKARCFDLFSQLAAAKVQVHELEAEIKRMRYVIKYLLKGADRSTAEPHSITLASLFKT